MPGSPHPIPREVIEKYLAYSCTEDCGEGFATLWAAHQDLARFDVRRREP